jgi:hypothetical protein
MTEAHHTMYKSQSLISTLLLVLGLLLLVFMITVEDEPGALPLALIVGSLTWKYIIRRQRKLENS